MDRDDAVLALGPIAVRPDRQRPGIGSRLIREALAEASRRGVPAVILLGDPGFYPRYGFEPGSAYWLRNPFTGVLPDGFVAHEEDFMLASLDERARTSPERSAVTGRSASPVEAGGAAA